MPRYIMSWVLTTQRVEERTGAMAFTVETHWAGNPILIHAAMGLGKTQNWTTALPKEYSVLDIVNTHHSIVAEAEAIYLEKQEKGISR